MKQPLSKTRKRVKRVSLILLATVLSYVIFSMAGSVIVFRFIFARTATVNAFELTYDDIDSAAYPREEIRFPSGGNSLFGCVYRPKGESEGLVMVLNGMNSCIDRHLPEILYFVDSGFSVMTFENTGVDRSEGENTVGLAQARLDTAAAIEYVKSDKALSKLPLFLSNEYGVLKTSKMLYLEVYKSFKPFYDFGQWIHCGDNPCADWNPKRTSRPRSPGLNSESVRIPTGSSRSVSPIPFHSCRKRQPGNC